MDEWPTVTLGDVCSKPQYGAIAAASEQPIGPLLVRQTDLVDGQIDWSSVPYCELDPSEYSKYSLETDDLLVARLGSIGRSARVRDPRDAVYAGYLVRFRAHRERALPAFLGYQLQSPGWWQHVNAVRSGAVQPTLNAKQMSAYSFSLPPLSEQRAIAEVLGALDDKIEANRRIAGLCEKLAVTLASLRPPKIALNAVARHLHEMVSPSALGEDEVEHFSLPAFDSGGLPMRTAGSSIKSGKFKLEGPAVLVSKLNPHIPRVWLAQPEGSGPAVTSTEFVVLAPKGRCPVEVLWAMCATPQFSTSMLEMAKGTTGSHQRVIPDDVLSIEVQSPQDFSDAERDIIVTATRLAQSMRRESADLAVTRDVLLPKLLSGELRVRDAEPLVEEVV
jgi:type I restriction enzyme S subunit